MRINTKIKSNDNNVRLSSGRWNTAAIVFSSMLFVSVLNIGFLNESFSSQGLVTFQNNDGDVPWQQYNDGSGHGHDDYELARTQSFGFFDDIPSKEWRELQMIHLESFPNYYSRGNPNPMMQYSSNSLGSKGDIPQLRMSSWWNGENFQTEFHCRTMRRVPSTSQADGPKWVCDPNRLKKKKKGKDVGDVASSAGEEGNKQQKPCLVYSFGSNGKIEFEQGIQEATDDSCEIHTFDMATYNKRNGSFKEALAKIGVPFHPWGLGTEAQSQQQPETFKTLKESMIELGHVGRTIDIFKIDCEWCEWSTYKQFLGIDNGDGIVVDIRQILVETHNAPMPEAKNFFFDLHDAGFVIFSKEANYQNGAGGVEFGFLKLRTDFFIEGSTYKNTITF